MKKLLMATTALMLLGTASAHAELNVDIGLGAPAYPAYAQPVYVAPAPAYYNDYGRSHHHRGYDWGYWNREHAGAGRPGPGRVEHR